MMTDIELIEKAKKLYEERTGWGDSAGWVNRDFIALSEKIQENTGVSLSHVTLKRVWGKVKYDSLPTAHTLDTLVQFLGYEGWRDFKLKNGNGCPKQETVPEVPKSEPVPTPVKELPIPVLPVAKKKTSFVRVALAAAILVALVLTISFLPRKNAAINPADYSFSSKTVVAQGLPNSVVFDIDATKSPFDSVTVQQSWDVSRRVKVPKNQRQLASIYYTPDYYHAKLIVGGHVVKEHDLLIKSGGWLSMVENQVPVYFKTEDFMVDGKMALPAKKILEHNIPMQPYAPMVDYTFVDDFGELYTDDFVFETSLKNDYNEGAAACQLCQIYILCHETAIWLPLCVKGCIADVDMNFTNFHASGKNQDLSGFGADFKDFVKLRIESKNGKAVISVNGKPAYTITGNIKKSKIIGFLYRFSGTGSVDYVRLGNGKVNYDDEF